MDAYVDVFISHKKEDTTRAAALKLRIKQFGYSCFIDADDPELQKLDQGKNVEQIADLIRSKLRRCRCLIFFYSRQAIRSKWMPWELGFFDGRWGNRSIGLYAPDAAKEDDSAKRLGEHDFSLQEYLCMYETVNDDTLKDFLNRSLSTTNLLNRTDVDIDRFMTLMAGAMRNPADFYLGCTQYMLGMWQGLLRQMGAPIPASGIGAPLSGIVEWLAAWRKTSASTEPLPVAPILNQLGRSFEGIHEEAVQNSAAVGMRPW